MSILYNGTINVDISPASFEMRHPHLMVKNIKWSTQHPAEDFSFVECVLTHKGQEYPGYVYFPHPETKIGHFPGFSVIEVLTEYIKGLAYGDEVCLALNGTTMLIHFG